MVILEKIGGDPRGVAPGDTWILVMCFWSCSYFWCSSLLQFFSWI